MVFPQGSGSKCFFSSSIADNNRFMVRWLSALVPSWWYGWIAERVSSKWACRVWSSMQISAMSWLGIWSGGCRQCGGCHPGVSFLVGWSLPLGAYQVLCSGFGTWYLSVLSLRFLSLVLLRDLSPKIFRSGLWSTAMVQPMCLALSRASATANAIGAYQDGWIYFPLGWFANLGCSRTSHWRDRSSVVDIASSRYHAVSC